MTGGEWVKPRVEWQESRRKNERPAALRAAGLVYERVLRGPGGRGVRLAADDAGRLAHPFRHDPDLLDTGALCGVDDLDDVTVPQGARGRR